jgi:Fe2+ or Zn2+ uptake regulation protein
MEDLENGSLDSVEMEGSDFNGYELLGCRLEYIGICPDCQKKRGKNPN